MAKKKNEQREEQREEQPEIQANSQKPIWVSFDQCWASCVKNGNMLLKDSAKAHLKATGCWDDQTKWIDGLRHFGIPVEN